jgi:hypothetical protein
MKGPRLLIAALLVAPPLGGADREDRSDVLEITHRVVPATIQSRLSGRVSSLDELNRFSARDGETIAIVIRDPNPFLFVYTSAVTLEETEQFKTASALGKVLAEAMTSLGMKGAPVGGAAPIARTIDGLAVDEFRQDLADLADRTSKSTLSGLIDQTTGTEAELARARQTIATWGSERLEDRLISSYRTFAAIARKCLASPPLPLLNEAGGAVKCTDRVASDLTMSIESFVSLALSLQPSVNEARTLLSSFVTDLKRVNDPLELVRQPYSLQRQIVQIVIAAQPRYLDLLSPRAKSYQGRLLRTTKVALSPYSPVRFSLAPAVVLAFIRDPTYTTVRDGNEFVITETDPDHSTYTVAAMLNIQPRAWSEPSFGGYFQVGVSPRKDATGFYLGGGIHLQGIVSIGGGFAYQQVTRLINGQVPNGRLAGPELLKAAPVFRPGGYVHMTVKLP